MTHVSRLVSDAWRCVAMLLTIVPVLFWSEYAMAELLCHVSDPQDPTLNVRESPGGTIVNRLRNERLVTVDQTKTDDDGRTWAQVGGVIQGKYKYLGWVFRNSLKCVDDANFRIPRVTTSALWSAGIASRWDSEGDTGQSISCYPLLSDGVTISDKIYESYRRRGFSKTALCFALGGVYVYFDPATGTRLDLYKLQKDQDGARPLWLPDCYREIVITNNESEPQRHRSWRPTGCTLRYHPSTGLPITKPELVELQSGEGELGGIPDEDYQSGTVSEDRLRSLVNGK
jgi:hypothetical protein